MSHERSSVEIEHELRLDAEHARREMDDRRRERIDDYSDHGFYMPSSQTTAQVKGEEED